MIAKYIVLAVGAGIALGAALTGIPLRMQVDILRANAIHAAAREAEHNRQIASAMDNSQQMQSMLWQVSMTQSACTAAKVSTADLLALEKKAKPAASPPAPSSPARTSPRREQETPTDAKPSPAAAPSKAAAGEGVQQAMLDAHNKARQQVGVPALVWSDDLSARAKAWAARLAKDGCRRQHSGGKLGENIYYAGPMVWTDGRTEYHAVPPDRPAAMWIAERDWWDASSGQCTAPAEETCGHYTQIVWKDTEQMGCGMAICPDKAQIWVCNYFPAGNVAGQKPY